MMLLAPLLLAAGVQAAPPGTKAKKEPGAIAATSIDNSDPTDLFSDQPIDWTKTYSLAPYREFWTFDVDVKDYNKDLPKVIALLEKSGAQATVSPALMAHGADLKSQQLSYKIPAKQGHEFLKKLEKLGRFSAPKIIHSGEPISLPEVKEKLAKLTAERDAHPHDLALMPSIALMVDEMIQHLCAVKQVRESVDTQVMLNLTVREKR